MAGNGGDWSTLHGWERNPKWDTPNFIIKQFPFFYTLFEYSNYSIDQFRGGLTLKQRQGSVRHAKVNKCSPYG